MSKFALGLAATALSCVACLPDDQKPGGSFNDVIAAGGKSSTGGASSSAAGESSDGSVQGLGGSDPGTPVFGGDATFAPVPGIPEGGVVGDGGACRKIVAIVRDFTPTHPDFERNIPSGYLFKGIVKDELDQGYPVYALPGPTEQTAGADAFKQWYVDTPGVNQRFEITLDLTEQPNGHLVYDNSAFFPIDGKGFGNQNNPHNYHFTTEVRTKFTYARGQTFTFRGDDDLWVFVNNHLVIDLGGVHTALEATVDMDAVADQIGIEVGKTYPMDLFQAERHTVQSNFRIETSIACFVNVEPPPPPR